MKTLARWLLLLPAVVIAVVVSWLVFVFGTSFAISRCPAKFHFLDQLHFSPPPPYIFALDINDHTCTAPWFQATDRALLVTAILLSILAASLVGFHTAPSHKRSSAALSSLFAVGAFAYGWVIWP